MADERLLRPVIADSRLVMPDVDIKVDRSGSDGKAEPKFGTTDPKFGTTDDTPGSDGNTDPTFGTMDPKFGIIDPKFGTTDPTFETTDDAPGSDGITDPTFGMMDPKFGTTDPTFGTTDDTPGSGNTEPKFGMMDVKDDTFGSDGNSDPKFGKTELKSGSPDRMFPKGIPPRSLGTEIKRLLKILKIMFSKSVSPPEPVNVNLAIAVDNPAEIGLTLASWGKVERPPSSEPSKGTLDTTFPNGN